MSPDTLNPKSAISIGEKTRKGARSPEEDSHVLEVSGLCVSCITAETCMYRKGSKEPVAYCEEFSTHGNQVSTKLRHVTPQLTPSEKILDPAGLKGLCVNCDHRATCTHAKTEGGIWHCEDYR